MTSQDLEDAWNFTPVIDLNYSLSSNQEAHVANAISSSPSSEDLLTPLSETGVCDGGTELGNFDKIWEFLGQPRDRPPPILPPLPNGTTDELTAGVDGGSATVYELPTFKGVRWRDEDGETRLADEVEDLVDSNAPPLSKARKKKLRAKKRATTLNTRDDSRMSLLTSSSEDEIGRDTKEATSIQSRSSVIRKLINGYTMKSKSAELSASSAATPTLDFAKKTVVNDRYPLRSTFKSLEASPQSTFKPLEIRSEDVVSKKTRLIAMLHDRFVGERPYLGNLGLPTFTRDGNASPDIGLHIFIDASNIMIGLHDTLKIARGMSISSRVRRQPISFHNLSIVLERGRPTAKRVLVGSDNFPAIQEAKLLGYETNILDRVHKAKELTPRQRKYQNANGATSSGSETTAAMYAPEKWVEQAVDEILHLKILESVVDAEKPSTIVLATGDAAEAEYSQGFLKMVERALGKGWKVEVCSFKKNISGAYRKKEFRARWGSMFKIIEMDDFVEELVGVE
ncbi:MAG: hypothetical protein Q9195_000324 [Heterodermia aff. obscurata]